MPRRILKSRVPRSRDKYSVEQTGLMFALPASESTNGIYQAAVLAVPASSTQGMRKVKHLVVNLTTGQATNHDLYWALVFVPEGYNPNALFPGGTPAGALYEPNQYVMNCGVVDPQAGPVRISSRISRNLNSGDRIYLVVGTGTTGGPTVTGVVRYAVTLQ